MRRVIAFIMTAAMLLCLSVCVFAEDAPGAQYTLYMDRNGKTLLDADGNSVKGELKDQAVAEFRRVLQDTLINWANFNYTEFEVFVDGDGNVTLGKQTLSLLDGTFRTSSNAEVGLYVAPDKYQGSGEGEVTFAILGFDGTEVGSATATAKMNDCGVFVIDCLCENCDENQDKNLHMMVCGHYYCEAGDVGHGVGACGVPGHMNCDGDCHDLCTNCQQPLCSGKHGEGVCEHVHQWLTGCNKNHEVIWAVCETCGKTTFPEYPQVNLIP